jgi:diaminohydroxyphosphoribosylaminopyrimidine deaminase/5-amino-6-(5-phosphoribosylamino)uracil reductase
MRRALELAARGIGRVEPNPPVGAVLVDSSGQLLAEGWHQTCGGLHAEVHALSLCPQPPPGATLFVTLEPCNHWGKTPPCTDAVLSAGIRRVVIALRDPARHAPLAGVERLRQAGVDVEVGLLEDEARHLAAPFLKRVTTGRPFVHAKWAMTLDGKIATASGESRWISGPQSRAAVHELRGRMDAILVGIGTALADDPLLTARPAGLRVATRIVLDSSARLPLTSRLVQTATEAPVLLCTSSAVTREIRQSFEQAGVEVLSLPGDGRGRLDLAALLDELGHREMTNVLIEGGAHLLGTAFDRSLVDEVHVFVAPLIVGGARSPSPVAGTGRACLADADQLDFPEFLKLGNDTCIRGLIRPTRPAEDTQRRP